MNNWILGVQYAACFGVELHINNTATLYFFDNFPVGKENAAHLASVFGWMNLFCRSMGGYLSPLHQELARRTREMRAQVLGRGVA